jgi:hypothetical protein
VPLLSDQHKSVDSPQDVLPIPRRSTTFTWALTFRKNKDTPNTNALTVEVRFIAHLKIFIDSKSFCANDDKDGLFLVGNLAHFMN